jgi:hypothetical protein
MWHKGLVIITGALLLLASLGGQAPAADGNVKTPPYEFVPPVVDMGRIVSGSERSFQAVLRNNTDEKLKIERVRWGCPCLQLTTLPEFVEPGGSVLIRGYVLEEDPAGKPLHYTLFFHMDHEEQPIGTMEVKAYHAKTSRSKPELAPASLDFGTLAPGAGGTTKKVTLRNTGRATMALLEIKTPGEYLAVSPNTTMDIEPDTGVVLQVTLDPSALPAGECKEEIVVKTDARKNEEVRLGIRAVIAAGKEKEKPEGAEADEGNAPADEEMDESAGEEDQAEAPGDDAPGEEKEADEAEVEEPGEADEVADDKEEEVRHNERHPEELATDGVPVAPVD